MQEVWGKRVASYKESGQTMKSWCAEQNLTVHQLKYGLYKDRKQQSLTSTSTTFRAVSVTAPAPECDPLWVYVVSARIIVRPGFEPQLPWDKVDLRDKTLYVMQTLDYEDEENAISDGTKTDASKRAIELDDELIKL